MSKKYIYIHNFYDSYDNKNWYTYKETTVL